MLSATKNQLKKECLLRASLLSDSSNWSAPKEETQALIPPVPSAMRASAKKRKAFWPRVAGGEMQGGVLSCGHFVGRKLSMEAESVNKTRPLNMKKKIVNNIPGLESNGWIPDWNIPG